MTNPDFLQIRPGRSRLILSLPHTGTTIPETLGADYVSPWQALADTDWWIDKLYGFVDELDVTIVRTVVSRCVIDVNRDPAGAALYPGLAATPLCPTVDFDGRPLYKLGHEPNDREIRRRLDLYHGPYHAALRTEIARLRALHADIVLFDAHSIRSRIPRLFDGTLPACNIGTNGGASASPELADAIDDLCAAGKFDHVRNGRFKGGAVTRSHGAPAFGVHAVQLELACRTYIDEPDGPITPDNWPSSFTVERATAITPLLQSIIQCCLTEPLR